MVKALTHIFHERITAYEICALATIRRWRIVIKVSARRKIRLAQD
jgi:hypothetical protein